MRIGLVLPNTPAYSETFFWSKIEGLQGNGIEVVVFAGRKDPGFQSAPVVLAPTLPRLLPIKVFRIIFELVRLFLIAPKAGIQFYRLERKAGIGIKTTLENLYLNSHILPQQLDWLHFGFATMALRREHTAEAMGARMAISLRGYDISLYPLKNADCHKSAFDKADKVHAISDALLEKAFRLGLRTNKPTYKITPAIDINRFKRTSTKKLLDRKKLNILTVARLKWVKGLEYTLEALSILKKDGVEFEYTVIGEGSEYERLAFAAYQLGLKAEVQFAGKLPHESVKSRMAQADIYLQYSIQEGFCNAVLEAQAMGLLCIVSDAEGLPENVLHGKTGWVVPKRAPVMLAQQIKEVFNMSPEMHHEIRQNAISRVRSDFNLQKQQQEFLDFYKNA